MRNRITDMRKVVISKVVQKDGERTQTIVSACKKNSTYETMDSWDNIASGPRKPYKVTPQQMHEHFW